MEPSKPRLCYTKAVFPETRSPLLLCVWKTLALRRGNGSFAHFSIVPSRPRPPRWDDALVEASYAPPSHTRNAYISYEPRHRSLSNEVSGPKTEPSIDCGCLEP